MSFFLFCLLLIAAGVIAFFRATLIIVPQAEEYVIERLGQYAGTWCNGMHIKLPVIDRVVRKVKINEQTIDVPPSYIITKDNASVKIDAVLYFKIVDSALFSYGSVDPIGSLSTMVTTVLRAEMGALTLEEALTGRDQINHSMQDKLDQASDPWGIKVIRCEIKSIDPPQDIKNSMEEVLKAERMKRSKVLLAEAERQSAVLAAQGLRESEILKAQAQKEAEILHAEAHKEVLIREAEGQAQAVAVKARAEAEAITLLVKAKATPEVLELKRFEAVSRMADGQATKIIVPSNLQEMTTANLLFGQTALNDLPE